MKSYKLIHQLVDLVEQLEKEQPEKDISFQDFAGFLVNHIQSSTIPQTSSDLRFGQQEQEAQQMAFQIDNTIGRLLIYMSRYAKSYIKKALEGTPLQSPEDFTCLAILLTHDNLLKGDLISRNIQEKTSGTEVIRRLIAAGLLNQRDDETDKRSKRVSITGLGKELLYTVFADMNHVGKMVTGKLTLAEKLNLQYLLEKLETFHYQVYLDGTVANKADLKSIAEGLPV